MTDIATPKSAETIRLSYSPPTAAPETVSFTTFLAKKHGGPVDVGNEWAELVNVGCGRMKDVRFVVEAVVGGVELTTATDVELVADDASKFDQEG